MTVAARDASDAAVAALIREIDEVLEAVEFAVFGECVAAEVRALADRVRAGDAADAPVGELLVSVHDALHRLSAALPAPRRPR